LIIKEKGFKPIDTGEIEDIVKQVLEENPKAVEDIKN
jgi:Asp-tRNA(Asn)/Glu-tRNA(Gln) amidotransferase B subunit